MKALILISLLSMSAFANDDFDTLLGPRFINGGREMSLRKIHDAVETCLVKGDSLHLSFMEQAHQVIFRSSFDYVGHRFEFNPLNLSETQRLAAQGMADDGDGSYSSLQGFASHWNGLAIGIMAITPTPLPNNALTPRGEIYSYAIQSEQKFPTLGFGERSLPVDSAGRVDFDRARVRGVYLSAPGELKKGLKLTYGIEIRDGKSTKSEYHKLRDVSGKQIAIDMVPYIRCLKDLLKD